MRTVRTMWVALVALCSVAAVAPEASSLQVDPAPWDVLVREAERVVHGHVSASWGDWAPDGSGRVITRYEVLIWHEVQVAGARGLSRVIVTLPGGHYGGRTTVVPGLAPLSLGEEVILLLSDTPWGWQPLGYELGILRLSRGETAPGFHEPFTASQVKP
jgi:hypothetical protein